MRKLNLFLLSALTINLGLAKTTLEILKDSGTNASAKVALQGLVQKNQISMNAEWAGSAVEALQSNKAVTEADALSIRKTSELSPAEVQHSLALEGDSSQVDDKARHSRPATPPNGALYQDVYQESPVLINYTGSGDKVVNMSFAIVYKYLKDANGVVQPHFVRAQLISGGTAANPTSIGEFDIDSRHRYYVSQTYGSEMDYAQFFIGGIAIHQTEDDAYVKLGGPASHGCVRHHEYDAAAMWELMGDALADNNMVNIKVYSKGVDVTLADGSKATDRTGFGALLNDWLDKNIECTRRGVHASCTKTWIDWN